MKFDLLRMVRWSIYALLVTLGVAAQTFAADTLTFLHTDVAGSPVAATDQNGAVIWREDYRPYGERVRNQAAAASNRQFFHGKAADPDTGLSYFGARYYDPMVGRFMGADPKTFDEDNIHTFNRYAYGNNNPYKFVDPDGNSPFSVLLYYTGGGYALGIAADAIGQYAAFGQVDWAMAATSDAATAGGVAGFLSGIAPAAAVKPLGQAGQVASREASSAAQGAKLKEHLRQLEKYGSQGSKELENGRIRYYGDVAPARNAGEMAGRRVVREWDPATGTTRTWHETLDQSGRVRIVRPVGKAGEPKPLHRMFDETGKYTGSFE